MKGMVKVVVALVLLLAALGTGALFLFPVPWAPKKHRVERQPRIIIPQNLNTGSDVIENIAELMAREEDMTAKAALGEGEIIVSVLNGSFDGSPTEKQFVAYRNLLEAESPIYITFIDYDESRREYIRLWSALTAATRPGTISMYTMDLLGDRSVCVLLSGMNGLGEHTLTVYRLNSSPQRNNREIPANELFTKIAELRIEGNISVRETGRSQAYQMGISRGESFTISANGRDLDSSNIMDQVETVYAYNTGSGLYEQRSRTKIPGTQIEQRRVRELLGNTRAFEDFVTGLWYYTTPQGTIDKTKYIYFSPSTREIIFYDDETQQVFTWQSSAATRYGLYVSSQNISISTLKRSIDLELETLDSIKVRVLEGVRLNFREVNAPWDGSYRKAGSPENYAQNQTISTAYIDAFYDSSIGKIHFLPNGSYEINNGGTLRQGKYAFFGVNGQELLELRGEGPSGPIRESYLVEADQKSAENPESPRQTLTLLRVRIGAKGIERLYEGTISLTLAQ